MVSNKPTVIFLMGPTASGKTNLAIALKKHLPCNLISVDSTLVYKGMNIGTAKPTAAELALAPHCLIDIRDPSEPYSAANFVADALVEIERIHSQERIPLLVGGTMLYFKALLEGLAPMPSSDPAIRAAIEAKAASHGWPSIHAELEEVDPEMAKAIHPNHSQRLARALEVYRVSGKTMTKLRQEQAESKAVLFCDRFNVVQIAIAPRERSTLHQRIEQRFHRMVEQGFEGEVRQLFERGDLHSDLPAIRAVGYRQMWDYLEGTLSFDEMIEKGIIATRQLAKRQFTWLRGWEELNWLFTENEAGIVQSCEENVRTCLKFVSKESI